MPKAFYGQLKQTSANTFLSKHFCEANKLVLIINKRQHTATYGNTLQHTATHCYTLQLTVTHCKTLPHKLQHTLRWSVKTPFDLNVSELGQPRNTWFSVDIRIFSAACVPRFAHCSNQRTCAFRENVHLQSPRKCCDGPSRPATRHIPGSTFRGRSC